MSGKRPSVGQAGRAEGRFLPVFAISLLIGNIKPDEGAARSDATILA